MATTAVKVEGQILLFMTVQRPDAHLDVDVYLADPEGIPSGEPAYGVMNVESEEKYHRELRKAASERKQWLPEFSTHPEFNPLTDPVSE